MLLLTDTIKGIILPRPSHATHTLLCQAWPLSCTWQNSITTYHKWQGALLWLAHIPLLLDTHTHTQRWWTPAQTLNSNTSHCVLWCVYDMIYCSCSSLSQFTQNRWFLSGKKYLSLFKSWWNPKMICLLPSINNIHPIGCIGGSKTLSSHHFLSSDAKKKHTVSKEK